MGNMNLWAIQKKLTTGIAFRHKRFITVSTKVFTGVEKKPHNLYIMSESVYNEDTKRYYNKEFYSTTSMVRVVMYLRDIWDILEGNELKTDQELWNQLREELQENGKYWSLDFC